MKNFKNLINKFEQKKKETINKKEKKNKKEKLKKPLLSLSSKSKAEKSAPQDSTTSMTSIQQPIRRIKTQQINEFDLVWNYFLETAKQAKDKPFEFLGALIALRFATEKEIGKTRKVVASDDTEKFLNELKSGAIEFEFSQLQAMEALGLAAQEFTQRGSVRMNISETVGQANSLLRQVISKFAVDIGLPNQQDETADSDAQVKEHTENSGLWRKYRIYLDAYTNLLQQNIDFRSAHSKAMTIADEFSVIYEQLKTQGKDEAEAAYYAEAAVKQIKNVDDYVRARKDKKLSLEVAVIYVQAISRNEIKYPLLYALLKGEGKSEEESISYSILLGDNNVNEIGFPFFVASLNTGKSEKYAVAHAGACSIPNFEMPEKYAEAVENGYSNADAKIYASAFKYILPRAKQELKKQYSSTHQTSDYIIAATHLTKPLAEIWVKKANEGKSITFLNRFIDAHVLSKFDLGCAEIYAETIAQGKTAQEANFNINPTFDNWFNINRTRNILISLTGVGYLILRCIGSAKIEAQQQQIAEKQAEYETEQSSPRTSTEISNAGTSSTSQTKEPLGSSQNNEQKSEEDEIEQILNSISYKLKWSAPSTTQQNNNGIPITVENDNGLKMAKG